jgi:hypothetical protein
LSRLDFVFGGNGTHDQHEREARRADAFLRGYDLALVSAIDTNHVKSILENRIKKLEERFQAVDRGK